jgi:hypothetical protein
MQGGGGMYWCEHWKTLAEEMGIDVKDFKVDVRRSLMG